MPSRLKDAASPYLEEAADQPVDWHRWDKQAFQQALDEDKPVLVDSGAVWCHWCHVMDHESYADPEIAEVINERFVAVKLDRDERPEIDGRLQRAVAAISGQGGWPLTAFLTPEGEVFFGGTYFPPEPTRGMPSFRQVLEQVASTYEQDPERARQQARKITSALEQRQEQAGTGKPPAGAVEQAITAVLAKVDPVHGGFGEAPKFPHTSTLDLLLTWAERGGVESEAAFQAASDTLEAMARGGLQDHLAGGFHRYSTDRRWHVPHFEKMLYDNGPLAGTYARAACAARDRGQPGHAQLFEGVARRIAGFMIEVLEQPEGGFGGSQDADRRPEAQGPLRGAELDDGGYFTWSYQEAQEAIEDEEAFRIARLRYGISEQGDMEHDPSQNVLQIEATVPDLAEITDLDEDRVTALLEQATDRLVASRLRRETPIVDPTVYACWNGMAIQGLLELGRLHAAPEARESALGALDRLVEAAWDDAKGFLHALSDQGARVDGLLEDQAHMLPALLAAHRVTGQARYLEVARRLGELVVDRYQREDGLFRETLEEERPASPGDQPTPAAPATLLVHLPRLARLTGEDRFLEATEAGLRALSAQIDRLGGTFGATLHQALLAHRDPPPHVVIVGGEQAGDLVGVARQATDPLITVLTVEDPAAPGVPEEARAAAKRFQGEQAAIVCRGRSCQLVQDPESLSEQLASRPPS